MTRTSTPAALFLLFAAVAPAARAQEAPVAIQAPSGPTIKEAYRFTLFHYATKTAGGCADFDYFRVSDKTTAAITTANAEAGRGMRAATGRD